MKIVDHHIFVVEQNENNLQVLYSHRVAKKLMFSLVVKLADYKKKNRKIDKEASGRVTFLKRGILKRKENASSREIVYLSSYYQKLL